MLMLAKQELHSAQYATYKSTQIKNTAVSREKMPTSWHRSHGDDCKSKGAQRQIRLADCQRKAPKELLINNFV